MIRAIICVVLFGTSYIDNHWIMMTSAIGIGLIAGHAFHTRVDEIARFVIGRKKT